MVGLCLLLILGLNEGYACDDCEVLEEQVVGFLQHITNVSKVEVETQFEKQDLSGTSDVHSPLKLMERSKQHKKNLNIKTIQSDSLMWAIIVWAICLWAFLVFTVLLVTSILPCMLGMAKSAVVPPTVDVKEQDSEDEATKEKSNWLGGLITKALEMYNFKKALGVDVQIGSLSVFATTGEVLVKNIRVGSPDGYYWDLLELSKIQIDLDMSKLVYSMGSEVVVEKFEVDGLGITIEKTLRTSNMNDFLKGLSSNKNLQEAAKAEKEEPPDSPKDKEQPGLFSRLFSGSPKSNEETNSRSVVLREISLRGIGVNMGFYCCAGHRAALRVGDLHYEDFDTQMCKHLGTVKVPLDVIPFFVMTVVRTILENLLGQRLHEVVDEAVQKACDSVLSSAKIVNSGLQQGAEKAALGAQKTLDLSKQLAATGANAVTDGASAGASTVGDVVSGLSPSS
mmetsp:Transcript_77496/g.136699  ORF Transcript_77496/g.136699 Transcript_77496/m.136699 type:complete len:452 (-) Transcript_77496:50-1405(-)|eukprot:CAMPEP_0197628490 /NCGR_PEP_ID=MMETSP1338-20131121/6779_1 /TAXON_ID=43686 ORGANISM="Pelagodinium beii, Strain RCC1491" /NCGR_SAMPLE_ID=MMETSP1338 /ASSEMBLY_ACC=CAM_ASM_000754 /LENGTH=451 /DNA_ID=CAMNT_0043199471 /DNA_START=25 /DNA_END=1380 /DNA_ORIENTATION=-